MEDVQTKLQQFLQGQRFKFPEKYRDQQPSNAPLTDEDIDAILQDKLDAAQKEHADFIRKMKTENMSREQMLQEAERKSLELQERIKNEMKPIYEQKPYRTGKFAIG